MKGRELTVLHPSSFIPHPYRMKLPVELQPGESVILRRRRTPVYLAAKLIAIALAATLPIAALLWLVAATAGLEGTARTVTFGVCALWAAFWLVQAFFVWYQHMHDEWIVTNQRLIDSFKRNPFSQQVSSADLVNVQDLSVKKSGLLQTLFNFGDVVCQTAGADTRFVLSNVPQPTDVMRVIDGTRDEARLAVQHPDQTRREGAPAPAALQRGRGAAPQFVPRAAPPDHVGDSQHPRLQRRQDQ